MCMTRCFKLFKPPTKRPTRFVKRWKFISYLSASTRISDYTGMIEKAEVWNRAKNEGNGSNPEDVGFHTYVKKPKRLATRPLSRPPGTLIQVQVAGLVAKGEGDGYGNKLQVETYRWMRFPKLD